MIAETLQIENSKLLSTTVAKSSVVRHTNRHFLLQKIGNKSPFEPNQNQTFSLQNISPLDLISLRLLEPFA